MRNLKIVIKGAGDIATGIAYRLAMANMKKIVMTEIPEPLTVRRTVAFSEAVYKRWTEVEGVRADLSDDENGVEEIWQKGRIAVIVDPAWNIVELLKPDVVIDAIMAKRNIGTKKDEARLVIGVGPGFPAPHGVHAVIESNRGHNLGKVIYEGGAEPYTGNPGAIEGYTRERVLRSPHGGKIRHERQIGDRVEKGDTVLYVNETPVTAALAGVVRGLINEVAVTANEKIGDIDPRGIEAHCYSISEKARAIGGGVLEAIMHAMNQE
jgi:xanthine dehydrogenase accessory factor